MRQPGLAVSGLGHGPQFQLADGKIGDLDARKESRKRYAPDQSNQVHYRETTEIAVANGAILGNLKKAANGANRERENAGVP